MVEITAFGVCAAGPVSLIRLSDDAGMAVELLSLGATVRAITVPDRRGEPVDVCLGYDTAQEYLDNDGYLGACVGRCANRIGGASLHLGDQYWPLTANEGKNQLHGGVNGFHRKLWRFAAGENAVTFSLNSPHLDEGFPGNLHVEVTYTLRSPGLLEISYHALSDRDTVVSLTNHSYFNLSGHRSGPVMNQQLRLLAEAYTPCDAQNIPTGQVTGVAGTALDLRERVALGVCLLHPQLKATRGLDHNFVLDAALRGAAATLWSPATGIALEVETTLPGTQVYTAGFLSTRAGKGNAVYGSGHGVCLETQQFPDAIHHSNFPSALLRAGEAYAHRSSYRFFNSEG